MVRTKRFSFRITESEHRQLLALATKLKRTPSDSLRFLISIALLPLPPKETYQKDGAR